MKPFFLTKLEALAIVSPIFLIGLALGAGIVYFVLTSRHKRRTLWENRKRPITLEPRAL